MELGMLFPRIRKQPLSALSLGSSSIRDHKAEKTVFFFNEVWWNLILWPRDLRLCMTGIKPEIAASVWVFEPDSLKSAFRLAGYKEEELASWRSTIGRYPRPSGTGSSSGTGSKGGGGVAGATAGAGGPTAAPAPVAAARGGMRPPPKGFVRLSPAEIERKRREGKCFNCDERFTIGHKCACPDLMMLVGRWEDEAAGRVRIF
ncbi:unnamed protein product [Linum trigynum]|uniref:Uncharacterized protein n=1 Tax=Linum trigynum TaxID=586398 RepID=A0AAV2C9Q4_9ROSI